MRAILVMLITALMTSVTLVTGGAAASATGGWAATYLDPRPARFEAGTSYALGFWVLQHGNHPFEGGELKPVGLRFTSETGKVIRFDGTALPEAGHYATSVTVPKGVWKVEGIQGLFQPHEVGTLTVPGGLKVKPVDPQLVSAFVTNGHEYWGAVRPPGFPRIGEEPVRAAAPAPVTPSPPVAPAREVKVVESSGGVPAYTLALAALGGALLAVGGLRLAGRRGKDEPDPPVDSSAETIVISG